MSKVSELKRILGENARLDYFARMLLALFNVNRPYLVKNPGL